MKEFREIEGTEFDWFAVDQNGHFALFATSGNGPVPQSVLTMAEAYDTVGGMLKVTAWGTSSVWQSYSQTGIFAYDWSEGDGCYVRVAEPAALPSPTLAAAITAIPELPGLSVSFSQVASVLPYWQDGV